MITIRNHDNALSLSARAGAADLQPGMIVTLTQGAAAGDQPSVVRASALQLADATVPKFIVDFIVDDDEFFDFDLNPATQVLTARTVNIPSGAQVNIWSGVVVVGYHAAVIPTSLENLREGSLIGFDAATSFPSVVADAELVCGYKYRIDGPEHTLVIKL